MCIPASTTPRGTCSEGEQWDDAERCKHATAAIKLMYCTDNTRLEIFSTVNQLCAQSSHCPKILSAKAIKTIARHLRGTRDKGIFVFPTEESVVDCDGHEVLLGLWHVEASKNPICTKSRTEYRSKLFRSPLSWTSKRHSKIELGTTKFKNIAPSTAMRLSQAEAVKPSVFDNKAPPTGQTSTRVFEGKNESLQLAKEPRTKPRNCHFAEKYHFVHEQAAQSDIEAYMIASFEQIADIFTKGLAQEVLETIRKLLCWCPAKVLGETDLREFQVAPSSEKECRIRRSETSNDRAGHVDICAITTCYKVCMICMKPDQNQGYEISRDR
jgi:hypothetical protein